MSKISENIKKFRIEANMTQKDLADAMGYKSPSTIAKIESGENIVDIPTCERLSAILHVSSAMLAGWSTDEQVENSIIKSYRRLPRIGKQYIIQQVSVAEKLYGNSSQEEDDDHDLY